MKRFLIAMVLLAGLVAPAKAQKVSLEAGLVNHGPLATEVTHRVRSISMPGSIFFGAAVQDKLIGQLNLVMGGTVSYTVLTKTSCSVVPCPKVDRDYRPGRIDPIVTEHAALFVTPRFGLKLYIPGPVSLEAGAAFPILQAPYSMVAASPMLVKAVFGQVNAEIPVRNSSIALFARATLIAPDKARWVAISEHTGYKTNGQDFPNGKNDPLWIKPFEVGISTSVR